MAKNEHKIGVKKSVGDEMTTQKLHILILFGVLFLIISGIGSVSASKEIVVSPSSAIISVGEVITIPIIMYDAKELTSFEIEVLNDVPGVTITLNSSLPLNEVTSASTYVNQNSPERSRQLAYWYDASGLGITRDSVILFYTDVIADQQSESTIPVNINVKVLGDKEDLVDITPSYVTKNSSLTLLEGARISSTPTPIVTKTPSSTPAVTAVPSSTPEQETDPSNSVSSQEQKVPTSSQSTPLPTKTQSSSTPIVGAISVILASIYYSRRHR